MNPVGLAVPPLEIAIAGPKQDLNALRAAVWQDAFHGSGAQVAVSAKAGERADLADSAVRALAERKIADANRAVWLHTLARTDPGVRTLMDAIRKLEANGAEGRIGLKIAGLDKQYKGHDPKRGLVLTKDGFAWLEYEEKNPGRNGSKDVLQYFRPVSPDDLTNVGEDVVEANLTRALEALVSHNRGQGGELSELTVVERSYRHRGYTYSD
jgi:hypothetical protein